MKTGSSVASIPNPTPLLFLVTAIALLAWPDAIGVTALAVIAALVVPIVLIWFANSPPVAIIALFAASAIPRIFVDIMGLKARPEHMIGGLMVCVAPVLWKKSGRAVRWIGPDYLLLGYIGLMFFSSAFMSIAPSQTTKWAVQQVLAIVPYFLLRMLITDRERFRWAFRVLLVIGTTASAYAILAFYSQVLFGSTFGVDLEQYGGGIPATYGLQFEANILGAYSAALAVMMLVMYLHERNTKFLLGCTFVGLISMAVSLSRAAIGAAAITFGLVGLFAFRRRLLNRRVVTGVAVASFGAILLVAPFLLQHYTERFSTVDLSDPTADPNTLTRAVQTVSAFDEVANHPVFGGGAASFQLAFSWESLGIGWEDQGWIGNTELRVLHDFGAVGLIVFLAFLVQLVRQARKVLKREFCPEMVALLFSGVVYCITFQATEGTVLAFPWIQLGLIGCGVAIMGREESQGKETAEIASS